jgi:hypothetical protein
MDANLDSVVGALAELDDAELHARSDATYKVPQIAPGLLAWIDGAYEQEVHRRRGLDFPLKPAEAAIPPDEVAVSTAAAMAMRLMFAQDARTEAHAVLALVDALVELFTGGMHRH